MTRAGFGFEDGSREGQRSALATRAQRGTIDLPYLVVFLFLRSAVSRPPPPPFLCLP